MDTVYHPQLATLVSAPPSGDNWLHEIKFDGYRIGCRILNGRASLISRNGQDWTDRLSDVGEAALRLGVRDTLLDGEVTVVLPDGRTSFQHLQQVIAHRGDRASLVYFVFDLLRLDGEPLDHLPLDARKAQLQSLLQRQPVGRIRYTDHIVGQGAAFFDLARQRGLEGIVSKRRDLPYHGGRHGGWVKTKCTLRQEFVIGGFTDPTGTREGIGALVIGHYEGTRLVCAGRVGTGFTTDVARDLRRRLDGIAQPLSPFDPPPVGAPARRAHWVTPTLVCAVEFTEWTGDGRVRHPSFRGLRSGTSPSEVRREPPLGSGARRQLG